MAFSTGTATSWADLSSALGVFLTTSGIGGIGTYTNVFSNGPALGGTGSSQTCFKHTASGAYLIFDSAASENTAGNGAWGGAAGESYILGHMLSPGPDPSNLQPVQDHSDAQQPMTGINGNPNVLLLRVFNHFPSCDSVLFSQGVTYWLMGEATPEYMNMVLEIRPGVFAHFWIGQQTGTLVEMASPFGGYMGCSGPVTTSTDISRFMEPLTSTRDTTCSPQLCYFNSGANVGEINLDGFDSTLPAYSLQHSPKPDWAITSIGQGGSQSFGPWVTGVDDSSGRTPMSPMGMFLRAGLTNNGIDVLDNNKATDKAVYIGNAHGVNSITLDSLLPIEEFDFGGDTYIVFPLLKRSTAVGTYTHPTLVGFGYSSEGIPAAGDHVRLGNVSSGIQGYAYKKTT